MFVEFVNQAWTPSDASVTVTDNTDHAIMDGVSKKLEWSSATGETVTITFDPVDLGQYEEICFYLDQRVLNLPGDLYEFTIGGQSIAFKNIKQPGWYHAIIDCSEMGIVSEIVITSLVEDLVLFIDILGYRKVGHDRDIDVMEAFRNTISLDYDVEKTLSTSLYPDSEEIELSDWSYVYNTSVLLLDNGVGTTQEVQLSGRGVLKEAVGDSFPSGEVVKVLCPTVLADFDDVEPNPVCGISFYDKLVGNNITHVYMENGHAEKIFTGALGVLVYIDCSSKKKLLQLAREYDFKYGERFHILLDGEIVFVSIEAPQYVEDSIGNNPRIAYFYMVEPQPYTIAKAVQITTLNLEIESIPADEVLE